jgi:hypothetical protein
MYNILATVPLHTLLQASPPCKVSLAMRPYASS